jgi:hypothetical protein
MFATPVLLITFNRPEFTQKVFDQIRKVKPLFLFIAADGPRAEVSGDTEKCAATREISNQIDWECELKTLFRENNRGCGHGPAEAITWFFDHVEEGIILEDDCFPHELFFPFCAELLERYRTNEHIAMISGTNFLGQWKSNRQSYLFSALGGTWGWASWRRAWAYFDYSAAAWKTPEGKLRVSETLGRKSFFRHYSSEFDFYFKEQRRDVWDFQWYFSRLYHSGYSIVPAVNLISNVGFDEDGTHTFGTESPFFSVPTYALSFPLKHTPVKIDQFYDWYLFERFISPGKRSLWKKVILKVIKMATKP